MSNDRKFTVAQTITMVLIAYVGLTVVGVVLSMWWTGGTDG